MGSLDTEFEMKGLAKVFAYGTRKDVEQILKSTKHNINEAITHGSASPFWPVSWTALIYACRNLNLEGMKVLLEKGADPKLGVNGLTPMMAVATSTTKKNQSIGIDCAKLLINSGLSIENGPMSNQRTLLTFAVHKKLPLMLEYFLEVGADPNVRDNHGETPLCYAVSKNFMVMIESLRKHGANPFVENLNGQSCLDIAKIEGNDELAETLLSWRKTYYKENFNKKKEEFLAMLTDVNAGCSLYSREPEDKSNKKKSDIGKDNKKESHKHVIQIVPSPTLKDGENTEQSKNEAICKKKSSIGKVNKKKSHKHAMRPYSLRKDGENLAQPKDEDIQITKLLRNVNESGSSICREERVQGPDEDFLYELLRPSDNAVANTVSDDSSVPLLDDISSESSSPPPSSSDSGIETENSESANGKANSFRQNLTLIVATAALTLMTYHLFRKFRTNN